MGFPGGAGGEESACQCMECERLGFDAWVRKIPYGKTWQPSILAGRISWTEEPGGLQTMGFAKELGVTERRSAYTGWQRARLG